MFEVVGFLRGFSAFGGFGGLRICSSDARSWLGVLCGLGRFEGTRGISVVCLRG